MSSNDIKIDLEDFQTILSKIGKIAGFVKVGLIKKIACSKKTCYFC